MTDTTTTAGTDVTFVSGSAAFGDQCLHVETVWRCPTVGYALKLGPGNAGINPPPGVLVLELDATPPSGPVAQVVTEVGVHFHSEDHPETVWIQGGAHLPVKSA